MSALEEFLAHNVEGYIFNDLREMQVIPVAYPLLMTTFAGIELLGALISKSKFDAFKGSDYFISYWTGYLYPNLPDKETIGKQLYQLIRNGIAHAFILKGPIAIARSQPSLHLHRIDGVLYLDAVKMADDFIASYNDKLKLVITGSKTDVAVCMAERLEEIKQKYEKQAANQYVASVYPAGRVATTAVVSHSILPEHDS